MFRLDESRTRDFPQLPLDLNSDLFVFFAGATTDWIPNVNASRPPPVRQ